MSSTTKADQLGNTNYVLDEMNQDSFAAQQKKLDEFPLMANTSSHK